MRQGCDPFPFFHPHFHLPAQQCGSFRTYKHQPQVLLFPTKHIPDIVFFKDQRSTTFLPYFRYVALTIFHYENLPPGLLFQIRACYGTSSLSFYIHGQLLVPFRQPLISLQKMSHFFVPAFNDRIHDCHQSHMLWSRAECSALYHSSSPFPTVRLKYFVRYS